MSGKRPNLSAEELERVAHLTEVKRWSPARIARAIGCCEGSVTWAQLRIGADKHPTRVLPPVPDERPVYIRKGREVIGFCKADDEQLEALALQGLNDTEIGRRLEPNRLPNTVRGRLMILARRAARAEAAAEKQEVAA